MTHWAVEHGDNFECNKLRVNKYTNLPEIEGSSKSSSFSRSVSRIFLPEGYPNSVRAEYWEYQFFDTLQVNSFHIFQGDDNNSPSQAVCSYLRGIFTTKALLSGIGVGDETASALAAALTWILRDGMGMLGGLGFSYIAGSSFDSHLKEWRLFADVSNDIGLTLELAAPLCHPSLFFSMISLATFFKAMCGVAAGSTKASITAHMALNGNTADVASKEGAQETLVSLLGMICGMVGAQYIGENDLAVTWLTFTLLTLIHVYANWRAVCVLRLVTFNRHRFWLVVQQWRKSTSNSTANNLTDPVSIAEIESSHQLWFHLRLLKRFFSEAKIELGVRLVDLSFSDLSQKHHVLTCDIIDTIRRDSGEKYIMTCHRGLGIVRSCFLVHATPLDELKCYFHGKILLELLEVDIAQQKSVATLIAESGQMARAGWSSMHEADVFRGWELEKVTLGTKSWRYSFEDTKNE